MCDLISLSWRSKISWIYALYRSCISFVNCDIHGHTEGTSYPIISEENGLFFVARLIVQGSLIFSHKSHFWISMVPIFLMWSFPITSYQHIATYAQIPYNPMCNFNLLCINNINFIHEVIQANIILIIT